MHESDTGRMAAAPQPIWATAERVARFRRAVERGDETARGIVDRARRGAADEAGGVDVGAALVTWWAEGDAAPLRRAADEAVARAETPEQADLVLARWMFGASALLDGGAAALDDARCQRLVRAIVTLIDRQLDVPNHRGDPHAVQNNHWAVTHSATLAAAMVCHGRRPAPDQPPLDLAERAHWARQRVAAYLSLLGEAGFGHEGIGYLMYAMSYVLPVAVGGAAFDGVDLAERWPALRRLAGSLFMTAFARPPCEGADGEAFGSKLAWNDDGPGWPEWCTAILAVHLAPADQTPTLRWMYDRLSGVGGSKRFGDRDGALAFTALFYPFDNPAAPPEPAGDALPTQRFDGRQGLSLFRNRYRDGDDCAVGLYAKATFAGGHRQDDAGSVRFSGLGHDWIMGGGQARPDRRFQSVVCPADGPGGNQQTGAVLWHEPLGAGRGGVAGCDLRRVSGGYHERWLAVRYGQLADCDAAIALLDLVDDHLGRAWHWHLTFAADLGFAADADGAGFTLAGEGDARMRVRFCGVRPDALSLDHTPESSRRFQSRATPVRYPPRPFVTARFEPRDHLAIHAVLALRRGPAPAIEPLDHLDVSIDGVRWSRPFGAALAADFDRLAAGGTCRHPLGRGAAPTG